MQTKIISKISSFLKKKIPVPETNEVKEVETVQLWYVRWRARSGPFHNETREVMEAFTSEDSATEFKKSLEQAFRLVKNTSENRVLIEKAE